MSHSRNPSPVVVGVDGSDSSVSALREAARLAAALHTPLRAIMCWNYPDGQSVQHGPGGFDFRGAAQDILVAAVERAFGLDWPGNLTTELAQGPPRATLIEASRDAELLVLGRRGKGGFKELLAGSVSDACTHHAHCPVVVVPTPGP